MVDFLSLFFILATAANLTLLWREGQKNANARKLGDRRSPRRAAGAGRIRPVTAEGAGTGGSVSDQNRVHPKPCATSPLPGRPERPNPYERAQRMIAQGAAAGDVARLLRLPKGEFELFLKLNRRRRPITAGVPPTETRQ